MKLQRTSRSFLKNVRVRPGIPVKPKIIKLLEKISKLTNLFIDSIFLIVDNFKPQLRLKNNFYTKNLL